METINLISNCLNSYAIIGDTITYHIVCKNTSTINFDSLCLRSNLNPNLEFIKESIKVNNIENPSFDIFKGICISNFIKDKEIDIKFDAKVISKDSSTIDIKINAECIYNEENENKSILLNTISKINVFNPSIYINQTVDKSQVNLNDTVNFKIKLVNNGDVVLDKILLKEDIWDNLLILNDSFKINSKNIKPYDLNEGINLGKLYINDFIILEYSAKIIGNKLSYKIENTSFVDFNYYLPNNIMRKKENKIKTSILNLNLPSFKEFSIEENIMLPEIKEDISSVENINTDINIKNYHVIKTPIAKSNEGSVLSGYKLIIYGNLSQVIRYSAKKSNAPIHSFEYEIPFSTFIILPSDYKYQSKIQIEVKEQYTHFNLLNARMIFENVNILLIAKTIK